MNNRALLFDLDGVIVDTARFHYLAWKKMCEPWGFELTPEHNEGLKGVSRRDSLNKILKWAGRQVSESEFNRLMEAKNRDYLAWVDQMTPKDILPGVQSFLRQVREAGYATAIGSASKNAPFILEKIDLAGAFDVVIDGHAVARAKPDPEVFTRAADLLGVAYKDCLVFEDSESGIEAALEAGMIAIGIGTSDKLNRADRIFTGFPKITLEFINQLWN